MSLDTSVVLAEKLAARGADLEAGATQASVAPDAAAAEELTEAPVSTCLMCDIDTFHPPGKHAPEILRDVRASFAPRSMHALLGQSATVLNILSGKGAGVVHGTLLLNGRAVKHAELKHHASLVPQYDIMYDALSVRETLLFYSKLRLPPATATATYKRVDALMERLGLTC